jgi:hypothetical protein
MPVINQSVRIGRLMTPIEMQLAIAAMQSSGPIMPVQIMIPTALEQHLVANNLPVPPPVTGVALIDTGASSSAADTAKMQALGVQPIGVVPIGGAAGTANHMQFPTIATGEPLSHRNRITEFNFRSRRSPWSCT